MQIVQSDHPADARETCCELMLDESGRVYPFGGLTVFFTTTFVATILSPSCE